MKEENIRVVGGIVVTLIAVVFGFVCYQIGKISLGSDIHNYGCEKVMSIRDGK